MGGIVGIIVSVALTVGSKILGKKLAGRSSVSRGVEIRTTPSGQPIPVLYGRTGVEGRLVYIHTDNVYRTLITGANSIGRVSDTGREKRNEFLMTQYAIGIGEIDAVLDVWADDKDTRSGELAGSIATKWHPIGGTADPVATAFSHERSASDKFTGLVYTTQIAHYDRKNPKFNGVPSPFYFVKGRKLKTITQSGTNYSVPDTEVYDANAIKVLLDYLTNDLYGPGLDIDTIDLPSAYKAQEIANQIVQGAGNDLWNKPIPASINREQGTSFTTWNQNFQSLGFSSILTTGIWGTSRLNPTTDRFSRLKKYEFHGHVPTVRDWMEAIDMIKEAMPGMQFFRSGNGKYKMVLPDSETAEEMQSVMTLSDNDLIDLPEIHYPDNATKLNRYVATFNNVNKNMASDTVTFPIPNGVLETYFEEQDGDVVLSENDTLECTNNPYHARSIIATRVLVSRRERYVFKMQKLGYLLEPGDVVRLQSSVLNFDLYILVETVSIDERFVVTVEAIRFDKDDYAWHTDENQIIQNIDPVETTIHAPTSITAALSGREVTITWVPHPQEDVTVNSYELQFHDGTDWGSLAIVPDELTFIHLLSTDAGTYKYRVRARTASGIVSEWTESTAIEIAVATGNQILYGTGAPDDANGRDGDTYIDTAENRIYLKVSGVWVLQTTIEGATGAVWHFAEGVPNDSLGANGDYYLNTDNGNIYQKQGATSTLGNRFYLTNGTATKAFAYETDGTRASDDDLAFGTTITAGGITFANSKFWVADTNREKVHAFSEDGTAAASDDFNLDSINSDAQGITHFNEKFWVVDGNANKVFSYNDDGTRNASEDFSLATENADAQGIAFSSNKFWIVDGADAKVYVYALDGTRSTTDEFDLAAANAHPKGITFHSDKFWVVDSTDNIVYVYFRDGTVAVDDDFGLASDNTNGSGIVYQPTNRLTTGTWVLVANALGADGRPGFPGVGKIATYNDVITDTGTDLGAGKYKFTEMDNVMGAGLTSIESLSTGTRYLHISNLDKDSTDQKSYFDILDNQDTVTWFKDVNNWRQWLIVGKTANGETSHRFTISHIEGVGTDAIADGDRQFLFNRAAEGEDGAGIEYIYAAHGLETLTNAQLPDNSWGYESPSAAGGVTWNDDPPALTSSLAFLFVATRKITGSPDVGDSVEDNWNTPRIISAFGRDGIGQEWVYTAHSSATLPAARRPNNSTTYGTASHTAGGQTWSLTPPTLTSTNPYMFASFRAITGQPSDGDSISTNWSVPAVVSHFGVNGEDGGSTQWYTGQGAPAAGLGDEGDEYLDVANGNVYSKQETQQFTGIFWIADYQVRRIFGYYHTGTRRPNSEIHFTRDHGTTPGITYYNDKLWVLDDEDDKVYAYSTDGTFSETDSFDLDSANGDPQGMAYHDDKFWVVDSGDEKVYAYNVSGTRAAASDFSLNAFNTSPRGITYGDNMFWVLDSRDNALCAYSTSGVYNEGSQIHLDRVLNRDVRGVTFYDDKFWVVDDFFDKVVVYDTDGNIQVESQFYTVYPNRNPGGITFSTIESTNAVLHWKLVGNIKGTRGEAEDGADALGREWIFAKYSSDTLPANARPNNTWTFDNPGTAGGVTWSDGSPTLDANNPYLFMSWRTVTGSPAQGATITNNWATPIVLSHFGSDGTDAAGVEWIFTAYTASTLPASKRPSNSWGYDSPGTVDGQTWTDGASTLSLSVPYLFISQRMITGSPNVGDAVTDNWTVPVLISNFAQDGGGTEQIFTAYNAATLPSSKYPDNSWGFDSPGTVDGQVWSDGAPNTDATNPYLFISKRKVSGQPATGTAVTDTWSVPSVISKFGIDGVDGATFAYRGVYNATVAYMVNDVVLYNNALYIALLAGTGNTPSVAPARRSTGPITGTGTQADPYIVSQFGTDIDILTEIGTGRGSSTIKYFEVQTPQAGDWTFDFSTDSGRDYDTALAAVGSDGVDDDTASTTVGDTPHSDEVTVTDSDGKITYTITDWDVGTATSATLRITAPTAPAVYWDLFLPQGIGGIHGFGIEPVYTAYSAATLPTNLNPSNSWGYGSGGTVGGQTWSFNPPSLTAENPYVFVAYRNITGQPDVGDAVSANWSTPVVHSHFGSDGTDAAGVEWIFARYTADTIPNSKLPSNSWGYDSPGTVDGLTWSDGAPSVTSAIRFLFISQRKITGTPDVGDAVTDNWTTPVVISTFGPKGDKGDSVVGPRGLRGLQGVPGDDGTDGENAIGREWIFTKYDSQTMPTTNLPNNTWGFDQPGTSGGVTWSDAAPSLDETNQYLFAAWRVVSGSPAAGSTVDDDWSTPAVISHYGLDGQGFTWRGAWANTTAYTANDIVHHDGSAWIASRDSTNSEPAPNSSDWQEFADKGNDGGDGEGYTWRGPWSNSTSYVINDIVRHDGKAWVCLNANRNDEPA